MSIRFLFFSILFLTSYWLSAQKRPFIEKPPRQKSALRDVQIQNDSISDFSSLSRSRANSKKDKPPVTDYKIISVYRDTTHVDTSLTIQKEYRFNFLRKDNFELLPFSNTGQSYNRLSLAPLSNSVFPKMGFSGKQFQYSSSDDVRYYEVPTPFTEMYFKTVMEQGQTTDILFTTNTSPRFNFSLSFKGLRSLGKYQHLLASGGRFRFTSNYRSPNEQYFLRFHYEGQHSDQEENGGLTDDSVVDFETENEEFDERSKLSVQYEDADNGFNSKRHFIDHFYQLTPANDSIRRPHISVGHRLETQSKTNFYKQSAAYAPYGELVPDATAISDRTEYKTMENSLYGRYESKLLGNFKAKMTFFNYAYNIIDTLTTANQYSKVVEENETAFSGSWNHKIAQINLLGSFTKTLSGSRGGDRLRLEARIPFRKKLSLKVGLLRSVQHPGLIFERYQSDYSSFDWKINPKMIRTTQLNAAIKVPYAGQFSGTFSTIDNFTFFKNYTPQTNPSATLLLDPEQANTSIRYLRLNWNKEFRYWRFALDNTLLYQKVTQDTAMLNVPELVTRNTLYYSDTVFDGRMFLQTGITFKYFSSYYMNGYHPVLGEFYTQNQTEFGGFPLIDLFVNAKVRQTRLYLKAEHFNSGFTGNTFYSAPSYPYRDYIIRFGVVWNFFM